MERWLEACRKFSNGALSVEQLKYELQYILSTALETELEELLAFLTVTAEVEDQQPPFHMEG